MNRPLKIGLIGGSGLGVALQARASGTPQYVNTPFGSPSSTIIETEWEGVPVLFLSRHGAGHALNPSQVPYRANIYALKMLGCTHILASGAVGSLREEFKPRNLVIPDQVIDKTHRREPTFFERAAVHVEFAEPFCPVLRQTMLAAAKELPNDRQIAVHNGGCYVAMEGPAFSTRAESLMHRLWGGDLIGMTAMPEAKLAKEAEIPYAMVSLVTDYDCWRAAVKKDGVAPPKPKPDELLKEIIANLSAATDNAITLLQATLRKIAADPTPLETCPALNALELAIWSDKSAIDADEVRKLSPLWVKYFREG
ncbi:MAG: MTAP family purine nucleoside phosphorylase [Tepidisphaeraceae bacterium]